MIRLNSNHVIAGLSILALSLSISVGPAGAEGRAENSGVIWGSGTEGGVSPEKENGAFAIGSGNEGGTGIGGAGAGNENGGVNMGGGSENSAFGSMQGGVWNPSGSDSSGGILATGWIPSPNDSPQQIAKELGEKDTTGGASESGGMVTSGAPEEHTFDYYVKNYK